MENIKKKRPNLTKLDIVLILLPRKNYLSNQLSSHKYIENYMSKIKNLREIYKKSNNQKLKNSNSYLK